MKAGKSQILVLLTQWRGSQGGRCVLGSPGLPPSLSWGWTKPSLGLWPHGRLGGTAHTGPGTGPVRVRLSSAPLALLPRKEALPTSLRKAAPPPPSPGAAEDGRRLQACGVDGAGTGGLALCPPPRAALLPPSRSPSEPSSR